MKSINRIFFQVILFFIAFGSVVFVLLQPADSSLTMPLLKRQTSEGINIAQKIDFQHHFQQLGVDGSILIEDLNQDLIYQHNSQRNTRDFLPASTFKILNSLIALEMGVIPHELAILTWDGVEREVLEWNRDLNLRQAFKYSAVWFYQVLARRVGYKSMQTWLTKADYGNQNIGSPADIDTFWLTGQLRITPQSQIQFLRRFYHNDLPFSERSLSIVKEMMIVEQTPNHTLRGKTGWATTSGIGWYVGYLEQNKNVYFFATNIDISNENDLSTRIELTRRCFNELKLL